MKNTSINTSISISASYCFVVFQLLSCAWLCSHITSAQQASLSFTVSRSLLKLMSIESVMSSNHLIHCHPFSFCLQAFPALESFPEWALCIRWPKDWSFCFSFSISTSNEYSGLISFRIDWCDFLAIQETLKNLLQHHSSKASVLQHSENFTSWISIIIWSLIQNVVNEADITHTHSLFRGFCFKSTTTQVCTVLKLPWKEKNARLAFPSLDWH